MAAPERIVRHLRLRAPGEAAVRRIMPTLEDALRCASLGDDGGRLIVVRKLALGSVTARATSQVLSRLIEQKTAAVSRQWVTASGDAMGATTDVDNSAADQADCVVFAGVLEARTQLASRLLRGRRADAWYWPPAVPEFDAKLTVRHNLARIALAIARTPEARVALPQWTAALVRGVGAARVAACFDEAEGHRLLDLVGLARVSGLASAGASSRSARMASNETSSDTLDEAAGAMGSRANPSSSSTASATRSPAMDADDAALVPRWLHRLLEAAGATAAATSSREGASRPSSAELRPSPTSAGSLWNQRLRALDHRDDDDASLNGAVDRADPAPRSEARRASPSTSSDAHRRAPSHSHALGKDGADDSGNTRAAVAPLRSDAWPWLQPTRCGGLLFLLPVLAHLGVPRRAPDDESACRLVATVLHLALQRSHAPRDDPMWQLAMPRDVDATTRARLPAQAQAQAQATTATATAAAASAAAATATEAEGQGEAAILLADARRWLHRAGRIGLVRLVRRRGHVCATATHVDLHFPLGDCELRLRRLGLDIDPGWLPWFGRVVAFHFGGEHSA